MANKKNASLVEGIKKIRRGSARKSNVKQALKDMTASKDKDIQAVLTAYGDGNKTNLLKSIKKMKGPTTQTSVDGLKEIWNNPNQRVQSSNYEEISEANRKANASNWKPMKDDDAKGYEGGEEVEVELQGPLSVGCPDNTHLITTDEGFFGCGKVVGKK